MYLETLDTADSLWIEELLFLNPGHSQDLLIVPMARLSETPIMQKKKVF